MKVTRAHGTWKPRQRMSFEISGFEPVPKGSMRGFVVNGRAILSDSKAGELKAFARDVRLIAIREMDRLGLPCAARQPFEGLFVFYLPRAKGHFGAGLLGSAPAFPMGKPDFDKLTRAACDAVTGIVYDDDSRIVRAVIEKRFATPKRDVGLWIEFRVLPATIREQQDLQQLTL